MGYSTYPIAASGVIKSIQRGTASAAGTVTITSVDMTKSTVTSFSNGSSGVVALNGTANMSLSETGPGSGSNFGWGNGGSLGLSLSLSGGTNTLVAASSGAYLSSSTQITVDGPCIWQVVEYN